MPGKTAITMARRPRKHGAERRRRDKNHRRRLIALGLSEAQVQHMTGKALRLALLKLSAREQRPV